jgi:Cu/Zn superoxide dismutase
VRTHTSCRAKRQRDQDRPVVHRSSSHAAKGTKGRRRAPLEAAHDVRVATTLAPDGGEVNYEIMDKQIKLRGTKANIIGRSVVLHADKDDCGLGGFPDSLTTGHSGKRIACAVIGYSKKMFV